MLAASGAATPLMAPVPNSSGFREYFTDGGRFMSIELDGISNEESVQVFGLTLEGVR
mgnify:CR=1 FL=1